MMFLNELIIQRASRRGYWRLVQPLVCVDYRGRRIEVPAGFETDGASIPRFLWRAIGHPMTDGVFEAAVIHDYLYRETTYSRSECDTVFLELMKEMKVAMWLRYVVYAGVRIGGHSHYGSTGIYIILAILLTVMIACTAHGASNDLYEQVVPGVPVGAAVVGGLWKKYEYIPPPTKEELRREIMAEIDHGLARKGLRWASAAGVLMAICVALHLLVSGTSYPVIHRLSEIAGAMAAGSTVAACWQWILMLAWYWIAVAVIVIIAVMGTMYLLRRKGIT